MAFAMRQLNSPAIPRQPRPGAPSSPSAEQIPINPRAQTRGETYKMIFALLYGLGLRVGEVSRSCRKDIDVDNQLLDHSPDEVRKRSHGAIRTEHGPCDYSDATIRSFKTLLTSTQGIPRRSQCPDSVSLAGFQTSLIGRFWVTPEVQQPWANQAVFGFEPIERSRLYCGQR